MRSTQVLFAVLLGLVVPAHARAQQSAGVAAPSKGAQAERSQATASGTSKEPQRTSTTAAAVSKSAVGGEVKRTARSTAAPDGRTASPHRTRGAATAKLQKIDASHPLAQAPSFELRSDGTSVVSLPISHVTEFRAVAGKGGHRNAVEYFLKGVQIGVRNNSNPLITEHFATPLRFVQLRRGDKGAILRLVLRERVTTVPTMKPAPSGSAVFEVVLPKPMANDAASKQKVTPKTDTQEGEGAAPKE